MGALTRAQIVSQAGVLAGRTNLTTQANQHLNNWLRMVYRSWSWPFLHKKYAGLAMAADSTGVAFGAGSGETLEVQHIFDPIKIYTADKSVRDLIRIRPWQLQAPDMDEDLQKDTERGRPSVAYLKPSNTEYGAYTIVPYPIPDQSYLLKLEYLVQPAPFATDDSDDDEVPLYPNDETMIQAVKCFILDHQHKYEELQGEQAKLDNLKQGDKIRYGVGNGINDTTGLDTQVFRGSGAPRSNRWNGGW